MKIKTERLANVLMKELNDIIINKLRDKEIKNTNITYVKLVDDLSYAKVYCSNINADNTDKAVMDLNKARHFIKSELCKRKLDIRIVPHLEFVKDESIEYGLKIEKIIKEKINN